MEAPHPVPGSGRRRAGELSRGFRLGALAAALLGLAAAPASAAADPGVAVSGPGVTRPFIAAAELAPTAAGGTGEALPYTLRVNPGEAGQLINRGGMPAREVIRRAGPDPDTIGYLTVPRPDGSMAYLPAADFAEPSPFEGGKPALISVDVNSTRFFRPVTSDPSDVNAEDNIATAAGEALAIGVHDGNVLSVQASASPSSTTAGQAVQLSASASGAKENERVSFRWSFGDGTSAEGSSVSHAFSGSGTYEVRVTAVGSAESGAESAPVAVVVGSPPPAAQPGAAPAQAKKPKKKTSGQSGNGDRGGSAQRGGSGSGPRGGNGSDRGGGSRSGGGAANGSAPGDEGTPASPASAEPTPTPASPAPAEVEPQSNSSPASEAAAPTAPAKPPSAAAPAGGAETVEGRLVANLLGPVAAAEDAAAAGGSSSSASVSAPGAHGGGDLTLPAAALIVLALLAAGVLLEWRGTRPRVR